MLFAGSTDGVGESGTGDVVQPWEQVNSQAGPFVSGDKIESFSRSDPSPEYQEL